MVDTVCARDDGSTDPEAKTGRRAHRDMTNNETIVGTIERVYFANADTGWSSGVLRTEKGATIKFAGALIAKTGQRMKLQGSWVQHPKFGRQFDVAIGATERDDSPAGFAALLAESDIAGLGPVRAKAIVNEALDLSEDGEKLGDVLTRWSSAISERANVAVDLVLKAADLWLKNANEFEVLAALREQGWMPAQSRALFQRYGAMAVDVVREDPYHLIGELDRFGFRSVDAVALKMGVERQDPKRMRAAIIYSMEQAATNGSTLVSKGDLLKGVEREIKPNSMIEKQAIGVVLGQLLEAQEELIEVPVSGAVSLIALRQLHEAERYVFSELISRMRWKRVGETVDGLPDEFLTKLQELSDEQADALLRSMDHNAAFISGGAGTGKTFTMDAACIYADAVGRRVALCAPTGKAAKRLQASTGRRATTIHRLLEAGYVAGEGFTMMRNAENPLDADLVIVDECSMVDVRLMAKLLQALRPNASILMVGDHNQIPSVGPGAILRDVLALSQMDGGEDLPVFVLQTVHRQQGMLKTNTCEILNGTVVPRGIGDWDVVAAPKQDAEKLAMSVVGMVGRAIENGHPHAGPIDGEWGWQVLSPMKKGPLGTVAMNYLLQSMRQVQLGNDVPPAPKEGHKSKPLVGDRVIWTKNDYDLDLMNGQQGIVVEMLKGGDVTLRLEPDADGEARMVTVPGSKRDRFELAYAMTIHKSQGSEWPLVFVLAASAHFVMHDRNLLYTGVSRAQKAVVLAGDTMGLRSFARAQKAEVRRTYGQMAWPMLLDHTPMD